MPPSSTIEVGLNLKDRMSKSLLKATNNVNQFSGVVKSAFGFLAGGFVMNRALGKLNDVADRLDKVGKLSIKLGESTQFISNLGFAAEKSGIQFNDVTVAIQRMQRRLADFRATGGGEAAPAVDALGIGDAVSQLTKAEDILPVIADAFAGIKDDSEKIRLAFKFFDSGGVSLLQLIGDGQGELRRQFELSRQLGQEVSQAQADAAAAYNDSLRDLQGSVDALANFVAPSLFRNLAGIADTVTDFTTRLSRAAAGKGFSLPAPPTIKGSGGAQPGEAPSARLQSLDDETFERLLNARIRESEKGFEGISGRLRFEAFRRGLRNRPGTSEPAGPEQRLRGVESGIPHPNPKPFLPFNEGRAANPVPLETFEDVRTGADGARDSLAFIKEATSDFEIFRQTVDDLAGSFEGNLTNGIEGFITGAQSASEAFKNFTKGVLRDVARMIAKMLALKAIQTAIGFFSGASTPLAKNIDGQKVLVPAGPGNPSIFSPVQAASGGVLSGPRGGFPAVLHGDEAVIPLPGPNRGVAVELKGEGARGGVTNFYVINATTTRDAVDVVRAGLPGAKEVALSVVMEEQRRLGIR